MFMHTHTYKHARARTHTHIHMHMHACAHVHTHTHTHTHTRTHTQYNMNTTNRMQLHRIHLKISPLLASFGELHPLPIQLRRTNNCRNRSGFGGHYYLVHSCFDETKASTCSLLADIA